MSTKHRLVIIGGGFGGLYAAKTLARTNIDVTLIDKRNFHLFQPLLYQVATGGLSPGEIASPLRGVLNYAKNITTLVGEVTNIDAEGQKVFLSDGDAVPYDSLIVATGSTHHYFGNEQWAEQAPGLKTIEDALEMRRKVFLAFEAAEREPDLDRRKAWLTFVIVGGGPTGVELAGAIAELAHATLKDDFRNIDPTETRIILVEGLDRVLPPYPNDLSTKARESLERLGVTIQTNTFVTDIQETAVSVKHTDTEESEQIPARTVLWGAGVKASAFSEVLEKEFEAGLDRGGRVLVEPDLSIPNYPNVFVVGDMANFSHTEDGTPLPGVAPVAMQQGDYVAKLLKKRLKGSPEKPFRYFDKGNLAVIGRNSAVAEVGFLKFSGFTAWLVWLFVHIMYLVEFDNRLLVLMQWAWNYVTRNRGARLITGEKVLPREEANAITERERDTVTA